MARWLDRAVIQLQNDIQIPTGATDREIERLRTAVSEFGDKWGVHETGEGLLPELFPPFRWGKFHGLKIRMSKGFISDLDLF